MDGVSAFIVGTSQLHPKPYSDAFYSMQFHIMSPHQVLEYHFECGSSIEFYVDAMTTCIDDTDTLIWSADELAFTYNIPILPDDVSGFLETMGCSQIIPYPDYPGFVKLQRLGKLRYNWHCKQFEFQQTCSSRKFIQIAIYPDHSSNRHIPKEERYCTGPAVKLIEWGNLPSDIVFCLWCPQWPKEARYWPFRRRIHGWPTAANIHKIVQRGCHVVNAKHPDCRNDVLQCRLSFSVAEVILLQSWTPVQQIVYHMLRFFAKRELIKQDCPRKDEVLCTYHFKTLMLWSCEERRPEWWNSTPVIEICCCLLQRLSEWLKKRYCPNYFIPEANLFHGRMNEKIVDETIRLLNEFCHFSILNVWFAEKYTRPILKRVSIIAATEDLIPDFGQYLLRICEIMNEGKLEFFEKEFAVAFAILVQHTVKEVIRQTSYAYRKYLQHLLCSIRIMLKTDRLDLFSSTVEFSSSFPQFGKVLFILHAANALSWQKMTLDSNMITEFIREVSWQSKVLKSKYHNFPKPNRTSMERSFFLFLTAQGLMENLTGKLTPLEFKLVSQMSTGLLGRALESEDSKSETIAGATLAYMAALHFATSEYETAIELCSRVITNKLPEKEKKEPLNAGCLLYIEDISSIIGFYLFFSQIEHDLHDNRRRCSPDLRLTPEVLAQYLTISSYERSSTAFRLNYEFRTPAFPLDEILMNTTNRKSYGISKNTENSLFMFQGSDPINKLEKPPKSFVPNEVDITGLLLEYSLENMTSFYNVVCKDFDIRCNTVYCYSAAYLYRSREYPEVLHLCERILNEPELQRNLRTFPFANVMVVPPLDSYFDSDIQCLLGFHTLVCYLLPLNKELCKMKRTTESKFQHVFAREIYLRKLSLSAFLFDSYFLKWHYFLGRHFLARYLKVRFLMDCSNPRAEVMLEFNKLKSNLPFEHIICLFLQHKLRQI